MKFNNHFNYRSVLQTGLFCTSAKQTKARLNRWKESHTHCAHFWDHKRGNIIIATKTQKNIKRISYWAIMENRKYTIVSSICRPEIIIDFIRLPSGQWNIEDISRDNCLVWDRSSCTDCQICLALMRESCIWETGRTDSSRWLRWAPQMWDRLKCISIT